ncbi:hypothetical protein A2U01_0084246, partial [Trifolium medium]|nr:hypothetical protein [Trifolium medium]
MGGLYLIVSSSAPLVSLSIQLALNRRLSERIPVPQPPLAFGGQGMLPFVSALQAIVSGGVSTISSLPLAG